MTQVTLMTVGSSIIISSRDINIDIYCNRYSNDSMIGGTEFIIVRIVMMPKSALQCKGRFVTDYQTYF